MASGPTVGKGTRREFLPSGSPQAVEKAQFDEANPRKSKLFSLIFFGWAWAGFARFG
jgi:hypothetical protein